ncbi:MAG: glutamine amidotransferase, partial [Rhodospirillaceae bacterium]|nr:glutamine amidotransferase [Rhodospirillaceae bacterium]
MFEFLFKYSPTVFENGELVFASGWPVWLLAAGAGAAAAAIAVSLSRRRDTLSAPRLAAIGLLQVAMVAVILTLLWRPSLSTQTLRTQENSVALLLDTSASMSYGDGEESRLQQAVAALDGGALDDLAELFEVRLYAFAGASEAIDALTDVPAPGDATRIGSALVDVLREARSSALGAVVLISDGADNSGELDTARLAEIAGYGVPVHAVGVGRESIPEDIELESVAVSDQVMPGSRISAQVSIRYAEPGEARLRVYDGDAVMASEPVTLPAGAGITTRWVEFDVGEAGVKDLRFSLDPLPGEGNVTNNTRYRTVVVPEARRSILYVEGEPRWEYKFIRRALDEDPAVRLASLLRTTPNKFYRQGIDSPDELEGGFPEDRETLFGYDGLVIGSFSAAGLTEEQQEHIRDFVSERGGSLLMLGGRRGLADGGWGNSVVAEALPVQLPDLDAASFMRVPVPVELTAEGQESLVTRLDADRETNRELWLGMPDIADFQYVGAVKPGAVTLLEAEVRGTAQPLLVHQRFGRGQVYLLASGGTWRWQMQLPSEDQRHETFWRQILHALVSATPERVVLTAERPYYVDEDEVVLRARVRDGGFEPVGNASVELSVSGDAFAGDPAAAEPVLMQPVSGEPGAYEATVLADAAGLYRFEASAEVGEETLGRAGYSVRRATGVSEHFQIQQNRPLLERVASLTGGRYFTLGQLDELPETIQFSEAGIVERELLDLWNMPFVFLLLLLLKAGEWVLRLFWGR